ncbi:pyridoxamine 5'-phosphate oxidase family protein [Halorussus litoreus]|uniref:pyridoxamine 5'-phosphate oxidase family protein n=1 Tax=Halorussus litoreus TaxID=1710536 RepID=UPI0013006281|nr:pyridoxamine 5'-phosphate oxidase family protein [Halorussus litoreus]
MSERKNSVEFDSSMSDSEIETVLGRANHGVLSLADADTAYSIPMSYGFDADANALVFQFVLHAGSRKGAFLEQTETASFTVSRTDDEDWFSVVAEGPISPVPDERTTDAYAAIAESAWFPDLTVFDRSVTETEFELFELSIESLDGRKAPDAEV